MSTVHSFEFQIYGVQKNDREIARKWSNSNRHLTKFQFVESRLTPSANDE